MPESPLGRSRQLLNSLLEKRKVSMDVKLLYNEMFTCRKVMSLKKGLHKIEAGYGLNGQRVGFKAPRIIKTKEAI